MATRTPIRGALRPRDPNMKETPAKQNEFKSPLAKKTPTKATLLSPTLPLRQRKSLEPSFRSPQYKSRKEKFDLVCAERCAEDVHGDLCDLGIQEWALDDFECLQKLGHGGTAKVYLVREKQSGYKLALKIQETSSDNAFCEIDLHDKLEHPNIVRMVDYFYSYALPFTSEEEVEELDDLEDGPEFLQNPETPFLYMILEVCEGGSLHEKIGEFPKARIPEHQAAKYFIDAIKALEYLHTQNVIHCDCKPANFLLDTNGSVKLADFGMAVDFDEKEVVGGSPVYMAPEHLMAWKHMTDNFDHRSDIYSLGVVLYEMLEGVLPYIVWESPKIRASKGLEAPIYDDDDKDLFPVLDLRNLDDMSSEEPFYVPPPMFLADISEEAQDLVIQLMEPSVDHRISLAEAREHPWLKMFSL